MTHHATKLVKTVTKTFYGLVGDLHGMQGGGVQIPLAPSGISLVIAISLVNNQQ
tara:strand:+ start:356 stop:517 length:162 start_codon:yes stop_codon:yes gene_type:complete